MKRLVPVSFVAAGLALVSLGACDVLFGQGPHVPAAYQGAAQITVANAWDHELCTFTVFAGDSTGDNWLGDGSKRQAIPPGANRTFSIKPGVYHVIAGFCDGEQAIAAAGTYGAATTTIPGPTLLAFGPRHVGAVAHADKRTFSRLYFVQQAAQGGGEAEPEEQAAPEPSASESSSASSSSSSSSSAATPSGPTCLPHGAVCNAGPPCCTGMTCASRFKYSDGSLGNGYCQ